jgi:hydroxyethylthiazole kinase-like uncharacterized protein yjeF
MDTLCETLEPVMDVADVTALEQRISSEGTSLGELMKRAGEAIVSCVHEHAFASSDSVTVLAGSGNNGGDGWVVARLLALAGAQVRIITKREAQDITTQPAHDAACQTMEAIKERDLPILVYVDPDAEKIEDIMRHSDAIIDAVLGTGFSGDVVRAPYDTWIKLANEARQRGSWIFSADVPSGLSAQDGTCALPTIKADYTVTMLAVKPGLTSREGKEHAGRIFLAPLGIE